MGAYEVELGDTKIHVQNQPYLLLYVTLKNCSLIKIETSPLLVKVGKT
jgi:hypothetical protein